jgi:CRP-like cAMP-binding protein
MQRTITLPFNLKDLADYLAINRSAMFRELRNLKDERIISVNGRRITLLLKNRTLLN